MGDEHRCMECCERDCKNECFQKCCCQDSYGENEPNILGLLILLFVIYCLFCNNKGGGLFGGLF